MAPPFLLRYISSMRRSVSSSDETARRELKIRAQRCIFDELPGVHVVMKHLVKKMTLEGEIKDAKMSSFSSDFQTLVRH